MPLRRAFRHGLSDTGMAEFISVIISSYNPDPARLDRTISALQHQTLSRERWELLVVDNNSAPSINLDLTWHPHQKVLKESRQGLTYARLTGFKHATGDLIIMVDDDNVLNENYLSTSLAIFNEHENLGAAGGKSLPFFEGTCPDWVKPFYGNLALRDLGEEVLTAEWTKAYPAYAPIGAGMCIRKKAIANYIRKIEEGRAIVADRTGRQLASGGDNDIVLEIVKAGWQVGYFPSLTLTHLIPAARLQRAYLARLANNINRSWVGLLQQHHINPWKPVPKWTVPFRKLKAWITYQAWRNETSYVRWRGACGTLDGLADINSYAKTQ